MICRVESFAADLATSFCDFGFIRCCGGDLATTSTARSKRDHASDDASAVELSPLESLVMDIRTILNIYADLLDEIKRRHQVLIDIIAKPHNLPPWALGEFAQLQVRMICETFAIGCLVAHGDVPGARTARLKDAYQADFIINALEKLHPHFYPRPTKQIMKDGKVVAIENIKEGYLTKNEFVKSYREAADRLHTGDLNSLLSGKKKLIDMNATLIWANRIVALLNHHCIYLVDPPPAPGDPPPVFEIDGTPIPKYQIVALMQGEDGKPHTHFWERVDRPPQ